MQFEQISTSERINLPKPSIDTGMGLERITAVILSKPIPVSIEGFGKLILSDVLICSNCIKTKFQISINLSPSSSGLPGGPPGYFSP